MSTRIWVYRHGESYKNLDPNVVGGQDKFSSLTDKGYEQANSLGGVLSLRPPYSAIYTSGCTRAIQTGWTIRLGLPYGIEMFPMDELDELSQGVYEGQPRTGFVEMIDRHPDEKVFGGQSMHEVGNNMRYAMTMIGEDHPEQDVMVVGHAVAMRCFLADLEDYDESVIRRVFKQKIPQCSETEIVYDQGMFDVRAIGRELIPLS